MNKPALVKTASVGMTAYNVHLGNAEGMLGLMMNDPKTVDPRHPMHRQLQAITGKRNATRTEEDNEEILRLKWMGALYYDEKLGPYLPAYNVLRCVEEGAKSFRKGADIRRHVYLGSTQQKLALIYDGPRTMEALYKDLRFVDVRDVGIQKSRVVMARPIFHDWAVELELHVDHGQLDFEVFKAAVDWAGKYCGLGTYRVGGYGRFEADIELIGSVHMGADA